MASNTEVEKQELELYRALATKSLDVMLFFRASDGQIISANPAALKIYGYSRDEILTKTIYEIRAPSTRHIIADQIGEALGESFRFETAHVRKDGSEFPVESTWCSADGSDGPVILAVARDITDRKRIDAALRESEAKLSDFFENAAIGLHWVGPDGTILRTNAAELEMLGYSRDEYVGRHIADFHVDDFAIQDILKRLTAGEKIQDYRARIRAKDGSIKHVLITSSVWFENGQFRHTRCFTTDITDKVVSETERDRSLVKEQEARREAETLNELARTLAAELDLQALTQRVTDAATELTGARFGAFFYNVINEQGEALLLYTLSGANKEAFSKFGMPRNTPIFGPTFRGEGIVRIDDVTADSRYGRMAPHHGLPPGHPPVRSYLAAPVISRSGEVIGGLFFGHPEAGVFKESDERMVVGLAAHAAVAVDNARLYEDLQEAQSQLERKVEERTSQLKQMAAELTKEVEVRAAAETQVREMLERIVSIQEEERHRIARNIHDELGQHLTALRINLHAMAANLERYPAIKKQAAVVEEIAETLDSTVDAVTWELRPAHLQSVGITSALENLVNSWSERFKIPAEFTVLGDPDAPVPEKASIQLYRITQEALHNISKHSGAASASVIIKPADDSFSLIIEDNGKGMNVTHGINHTKPGDRRCLGLVSMKERAALVDGSLEIESAPGRGTTIFIRLPIH